MKTNLRKFRFERGELSQQAVADMVGRTETDLGPVDVLLNNAGSFNTIGPVYEIDPDSWWNDITVNLTASSLILPVRF